MVNPSFKRTPTRSQLDSLAHQVDSLRQLLGASPEGVRKMKARPPQTIQSESDPSIGDHATSLPVLETQSLEADDIFGLQAASSNLDQVIPSHLGNVEFSSEAVLTLFNFFLQHQYYHLPILDTRTSIGSMQKNTPLLFWTIIAVSCRFHPNYCHMLPLLRDPYQVLLGRALTTSPMSLCTVQALLVLCHWPFPCEKQPQDPSWNYCGTAINAALYLGLNSPKYHISSQEQNIRSRTWLACFYIGTYLSMRLGLPPPIQSSSSLAAIANMITEVDMPEDFAAQVEIQRHVARYMTILTADQDYKFNVPAMKIFERELDGVSLHFKASWNTETEFNLLRAKLSLYALACINNPVPDRSASLSISRSNNDQDLAILKLAGLYFASKLVRIFSDIVDAKAAITCTLPTTDSLPTNATSTCIPKFYSISLCFATFFLLKFCAFDGNLTQSDRDTAENTIKIAYDMFLRTSIHPLDESGRVAKVVEVLSKTGDSELRIKDRRDASIVYDSLRRAAELRGRQTDEPIPEICLEQNGQANNDDPGGVSIDGASSSSTLLGLEYLDPWISYLGLPGESWAHGDLESYNVEGSGSFSMSNSSYPSEPT